jgi:hypothetical protein
MSLDPTFLTKTVSTHKATKRTPRGAGHTFGNDGDEPARLLVLHAPAMDAYFAELDALWFRAGAARPRAAARPDGPLRHGAGLGECASRMDVTTSRDTSGCSARPSASSR